MIRCTIYVPTYPFWLPGDKSGEREAGLAVWDIQPKCNVPFWCGRPFFRFFLDPGIHQPRECNFTRDGWTTTRAVSLGIRPAGWPGFVSRGGGGAHYLWLDPYPWAAGDGSWIRWDWIIGLFGGLGDDGPDA